VATGTLFFSCIFFIKIQKYSCKTGKILEF